MGLGKGNYGARRGGAGGGKKPLGAEFVHMNLVARILVFPLTLGSYSVPPAGNITNLAMVMKDESTWEMPHPPFHPEHFMESQDHFMKQGVFMLYLAVAVPFLGCLEGQSQILGWIHMPWGAPG